VAEGASGIRGTEHDVFGFERVDPSVKAREHGLQVPGPCVYKYSRDSQELDGGIKVLLPVVTHGPETTLCNEILHWTFATILGTVQGDCKAGFTSTPERTVGVRAIAILFALLAADFLLHVRWASQRP